MSENRKPGFYWNPNLTMELTPEQRKMIAEHERLHLKYVAARRGVPAEVLAEATRSIDAFERGEPCPEPFEGEGLCAAHYPVVGSSHLTNEETDRRIQSVLQSYEYLKNAPLPVPGSPEDPVVYTEPTPRSYIRAMLMLRDPSGSIPDDLLKTCLEQLKSGAKDVPLIEDYALNIPGSNPATGESLVALNEVMANVKNWNEGEDVLNPDVALQDELDKCSPEIVDACESLVRQHLHSVTDEHRKPCKNCGSKRGMTRCSDCNTLRE
jgi:hypothetical protein